MSDMHCWNYRQLFSYILDKYADNYTFSVWRVIFAGETDGGRW